MAFDTKTRNRLNQFVGNARALLTDKFTEQCQVEFGMNPETGEVTELEQECSELKRENDELKLEVQELDVHPNTDVVRQCNADLEQRLIESERRQRDCRLESERRLGAAQQRIAELLVRSIDRHV